MKLALRKMHNIQSSFLNIFWPSYHFHKSQCIPVSMEYFTDNIAQPRSQGHFPMTKREMAPGGAGNEVEYRQVQLRKANL